MQGDALGIVRHRDRAVVGPKAEVVSVDAADKGVAGTTETRRRLGHRIEDRLYVGARARYDAKDLGRRRLMLQRLAEVAVALLQFLEQADVLDGDDRLVGEGLQQRHLLVREGNDLRP